VESSWSTEGSSPAGGLSIISPQAIYIQGDYNTGTNGAAQPPSNTATSYTPPVDTPSPVVGSYVEAPSAVVGDAVNNPFERLERCQLASWQEQPCGDEHDDQYRHRRR